jgi:Domain of unknown function (DUF4397)
MSEFVRWASPKLNLTLTCALLLVLSTGSGCASSGQSDTGGSSETGGQSGQALFRVFNQWATPSSGSSNFGSSGGFSPVTVYVDKKDITDTLAYPESIGPLSISPGNHNLYIGNLPPQGFGPPPLASATATLAAGTQTSFYYIGPGIFGGVLLQAVDDTTPAANSQAKLRVVIGVGGPVGLGEIFDVYVVSSGSAPSGSPTFSNLTESSGPGLSDVSKYQTLAPGTYDVDFTNPGTTDVVYTLNSLTLAASQNRTVLLTDNQTPFGSAIIADLN